MGPPRLLLGPNAILERLPWLKDKEEDGVRLPLRWRWEERRLLPRFGAALARRDGCCFMAEGMLRMGAPPMDMRTLRPLLVTGPSVVRLIIFVFQDERGVPRKKEKAKSEGGR